MTDFIEKSVENYELLLNYQIKQTQKQPNDTTECVDCGNPIGDKRKQAVPYAVRCVACQSEFERGKK